MFIDTSNKKINISVSELVFLTCRRREPFLKFDKAIKDDSAFSETAVKRQEEQKGNTYYTDISLSCSLKIRDFQTEISGNTSLLSENDKYIVDVVKSVRYPVNSINEFFIHNWLSEAKCTAFIFANKHSLKSITVRLNVFHTETLEKRNFVFLFEYNELEQFFKQCLQSLVSYLDILIPHAKKRNDCARAGKFPYAKVREGQEEISKEIYRAVKNKSKVIISAPTGIGKTSAVLYPALKAQGNQICNKIFYLTAKTSGANSAVDAIKIFGDAGYDVVASVISSKAKLCSNRVCSPQTCKFSNGHHDRMMSAVFEVAKSHTIFSSDIVNEYAGKYDICPFMLEMELAHFSDVIICDYNYVFDPAVSQKLSSCFSGNDIVLVDEAHNLIDRMRNIFSSEIKLAKLMELEDSLPENRKLKTATKNFLAFIQEDSEDCGGACEPLSSQSLDGLEREINALFYELQNFFESDKNASASECTPILDSLRKFAELLTHRSDEYITFYNDDNNPEIFMVDTSKALRRRADELGTVALFSATLFPEDYYRYMLGANRKDAYLPLPSPFSISNFLVLGYPVSTKYSDRENSIEDVVCAIYSAGRVKVGNYISFFPSYQYMELAVNAFCRLFPDEKVIYQRPSMNDQEKKTFLDCFASGATQSMYAFAVLGGSFSEGVDLAGDKLSGACVIGLGSLPPSRRSSLIAGYFTELFFDGEKFAYHYPGLNKVFQAGGRVIRTENDKGFLLIIDDRFFGEDNVSILPDSWKNVRKVKNNSDIVSQICEFWKN